MIDGLPPVRAFGVWNAPMTDGAEWLDAVPTHLGCMHCRETFRDGDNGAIMSTGFAMHRECSLRSVLGGIGHVVDHDHYCSGELGPDAGFSYRASAMMVWNMNVNRVPVTRATLALLAGERPG